MTNAALQMEKFKSIDQLLPARGPAIYNAGIRDNDKGYVKYGPKSSDQPTLMIIDPIYDEDRNIITPGYYELMLSEDRQTLLLTQRQTLIATIPVFRIEEDKNQEQFAQPRDWLSQKKYDRKQKKEAKKKKKLIAEGKMADEPGIYNKATIEYNEQKDYYLIQYERGRVKAWGALKL